MHRAAGFPINLEMNVLQLMVIAHAFVPKFIPLYSGVAVEGGTDGVDAG